MMNAQHIGILKKGLIGYWLSVFIIGYLFGDSVVGKNYIYFAIVILLAHVVETFLFDKVLKEHSNNVLLDKFLMLPFGFLIPAGLKIQAASKKAQ
jgi:hypothetical protein